MATRANLETLLVRRFSGLLTTAGMAVTYAGSNADLNGPLAYAVRQCAGTVADPTSVTDSEIAGAFASAPDRFLDLAELSLLEALLARLNDGTQFDGPGGARMSQLCADVRGMLDRKQAMVERAYKGRRGTLEAGVILLDFMEQAETT